MEGEINKEAPTHGGNLQYRKGCPACEHSDPELERELQVFAQLLLDIHLAKREERQRSEHDPGIDILPGLPRLEIKVE